jgi:coproporphyrinogen III oxidase-like Fe-S oxidoreductase
MDTVSRARELVMLRMRLLDGVERLPEELGEAETDRLRDVLEHYAELGLVRRQGEGYALSRRGLLLSNEVFAELI